MLKFLYFNDDIALVLKAVHGDILFRSHTGHVHGIVSRVMSILLSIKQKVSKRCYCLIEIMDIVLVYQRSLHITVCYTMI